MPGWRKRLFGGGQTLRQASSESEIGSYSNYQPAGLLDSANRIDRGDAEIRFREAERGQDVERGQNDQQFLYIGEQRFRDNAGDRYEERQTTRHGLDRMAANSDRRTTNTTRYCKILADNGLSYSGLGDDAEAFIRKFETAAAWNDWSGKELVRYFYFSLTDLADRWFTSSQKSLEEYAESIGPLKGIEALSYEIVKEAFLKRFAAPHRAHVAKHQLNKIRQEANENISTFVARVQHLGDSAYPNTDHHSRQEHLLYPFLEGLYDQQVKLHVLASNPLTLEQAFVRALSLETSRQMMDGSSMGTQNRSGSFFENPPRGHRGQDFSNSSNAFHSNRNSSFFRGQGQVQRSFGRNNFGQRGNGQQGQSNLGNSFPRGQNYSSSQNDFHHSFSQNNFRTQGQGHRGSDGERDRAFQSGHEEGHQGQYRQHRSDNQRRSVSCNYCGREGHYMAVCRKRIRDMGLEGSAEGQSSFSPRGPPQNANQSNFQPRDTGPLRQTNAIAMQDAVKNELTMEQVTEQLQRLNAYINVDPYGINGNRAQQQVQYMQQQQDYQTQSLHQLNCMQTKQETQIHEYKNAYKKLNPNPRKRKKKLASQGRHDRKKVSENETETTPFFNKRFFIIFVLTVLLGHAAWTEASGSSDEKRSLEEVQAFFSYLLSRGGTPLLSLFSVSSSSSRPLFSEVQGTVEDRNFRGRVPTTLRTKRTNQCFTRNSSRCIRRNVFERKIVEHNALMTSSKSIPSYRKLFKTKRKYNTRSEGCLDIGYQYYHVSRRAMFWDGDKLKQDQCIPWNMNVVNLNGRKQIRENNIIRVISKLHPWHLFLRFPTFPQLWKTIHYPEHARSKHSYFNQKQNNQFEGPSSEKYYATSPKTVFAHWTQNLSTGLSIVNLIIIIRLAVKMWCHCFCHLCRKIKGLKKRQNKLTVQSIRRETLETSGCGKSVPIFTGCPKQPAEKLPLVGTNILGYNLLTLIDSGATMSVMSYDALERMPRLLASATVIDCKAISACEKPMLITHKIDIPIKVGQFSTNHSCGIINHLMYDLILGMDALDLLKGRTRKSSIVGSIEF